MCIVTPIIRVAMTDHVYCATIASTVACAVEPIVAI